MWNMSREVSCISVLKGVFPLLQPSLCSVLGCLCVRKALRMNAIEWFNIFHGRQLCSCLCITGGWRLTGRTRGPKEGFLVEYLLRMASLLLEPETRNRSSRWFQPLLWSISFSGKSKVLRMYKVQVLRLRLKIITISMKALLKIHR